MAIAATRSGKVEGLEVDGILQFRGVPYATPPVGSLRWQPPVLEEAWDGVRDASKFSAHSAQTEFAMTQMLGGAPPVRSEDSLYLNVFTPACDDARRPVLFWIHGGAFMWGSGDTPWYDGTNFARNGDVVVVTINYRLGPFGFMYLGEQFPELPDSANLGLLDQVAALEWVRDCIGSFGGDPDRVTIFGESAGAGSVGTLLGMPRARGLFRAALAESGAASWVSSPARASTIAAAVVERLGVRPGDLDALLAKSTDDVLAALPQWQENGVSGLPFQPVVDGRSLPEPPLDAIAAGNADGVRLLAGTNLHEMTLFVLADPTYFALGEEAALQRLRNIVGEAADALFAGYRARRPGVSTPELYSQLLTDGTFRIPAIRLLEAQSAHAPAWAYLFTWETPAFGGLLKSTHALEIPFVWDTLHREGSALFTGDGQERQGIADAMHRAWIAFAREGDPNHAGLPAWPQYDRGRRATMRFDTTCEVLDDPAGDDRAEFDAVLPRHPLR